MQTKEATFIQQVGQNNLRLTKNRLDIFNILNSNAQPMTIQQIVSNSEAKSHFTSVYRSVDSLVKTGILREVSRGFKTYYELGEKLRPHHHHITCETCHKSQPIENDKIESLVHDLAESQGFKLTGHHFELAGICQSCQSKSY